MQQVGHTAHVPCHVYILYFTLILLADSTSCLSHLLTLQQPKSRRHRSTTKNISALRHCNESFIHHITYLLLLFHALALINALTHSHHYSLSTSYPRSHTSDRHVYILLNRPHVPCTQSTRSPLRSYFTITYRTFLTPYIHSIVKASHPSSHLSFIPVDPLVLPSSSLRTPPQLPSHPLRHPSLLPFSPEPLFAMGTETFVWPVANVSARAALGPALQLDTVEGNVWMVVLAGILGFFMAWGIGANDVANAFATSVGAGSLTLPTAVAIAAVMEFAGSVLLGGKVVSTVRMNMISVSVFDPNLPGSAANGPDILMTGFLIALFAATSWLVIATYFALPISTTHSIIGAIVGMGVAYRGWGVIIWIPKDVTGFDKLRGLAGVILSWLASPILSSIFAVAFFLIVRTFILRRENSYRAGVFFMPILFAFTLAIAVFFIIYNGDKRFNIRKSIGTGGTVGVALGFGVFIALASWYFIVPLAKNAVERWEARQIDMAKDLEAVRAKHARKNKVSKALSKVGINLTVDTELSDDVIRMHDIVEKFEPKTERLFTWVQVFTAAVDSFAHGANDVANAVAPLTTIYQLQRNNGRISEARTDAFKKDGTYSGGLLNSQSFKTDDDLPNGKSFCGKADGDTYFQCTDVPSFPSLTSFDPNAKSRTFSLYDTNGVVTTEAATCYTKCSPRSFTAYEDLKQDLPLWILAMGGAGIVAGLAMWGYRIIQVIGVKLTKLTPARGFSIEIGAAITTLAASQIGIPVSTTHCQVGATMGVGAIEGKMSSVNWKSFFFFCCGWVFTVIFTGVLAAILFLIICQSPMAFPAEQGEVRENLLDFCPGNRMFVYDNDTSQFRGVACSGFLK